MPLQRHRFVAGLFVHCVCSKCMLLCMAYLTAQMHISLHQVIAFTFG